MSATPSQAEESISLPAQIPRRASSQSDRTVAHYREAIWTARIALLVSIGAAGLAFVAAVLAAISLYQNA